MERVSSLSGAAGGHGRWAALFGLLVVLFFGVSARAMAAGLRQGANFVRVAPLARLAPGGSGVAVSGSVRCVKGDHVRVSVWVFEPSRGALAKGSTPASPSTAGSLGLKPSPIVCHGVGQRWSLSAVPAGKRPASFSLGAGKVCATMIASRKYVYTDLQQVCMKVVFR